LGGVKRKATAVAIMAVTGLFSSMIHAIRAANINPIETLGCV
jgi:ABC-type lipoprotein release transport system permease subunit